MTYIITESSTYYPSSRDVQVADRVYPGVHTHVVKNLVDNDGRRKVVNYLDGDKSDFVSYVENNKVVRSEERFLYPQTMTLGNKTYSGIVSKVEIPGKYETYSVFKPNGYFNDIRVRANGTTVDMNEFRNKLMLRKFKAPFVKMARLIAGK